MAAIYDSGGDVLTDGLQGSDNCDEAVIAARNWARRLGKPVILDDDDGRWQVDPDGSITEDGDE